MAGVITKKTLMRDISLANHILGQKLEKSNIQETDTLSKAHIRPCLDVRIPRVEYILGGSLIRTTKDIKCSAVGGGKRGGIKGFSIQSRRRMLEQIASIKRDAILPCFVTLTYPNEFPTVARSKRDLKIFHQRMVRKFPQIGLMWKLEPQKRGAPHFHMLVWNVERLDLFMWVVNNWYEIAGNGDIRHKLFHMGCLKDSEPCVSQVKSFKGVWFYAAKYIGKTFEVAEWGKTWTGRFWGTVNRQNIPFGSIQTIELSENEIVQIMRYQRKFMSISKKLKHQANKKRTNLISLKTFCDANQWIIKLSGSWSVGGSPGGPAPDRGGNRGEPRAKRPDNRNP